MTEIIIWITLREFVHETDAIIMALLTVNRIGKNLSWQWYEKKDDTHHVNNIHDVKKCDSKTGN